MKQNIKSLVCGVVIGTMLTSGITLAKSGTEMLEAWFSDIKIFVNGAKIDPKDANGNSVEPFIVNGTTYLPVRAIGEALGKEVSWDGATNSVYLADKKIPAETPQPVETPEPTAKPTPTPNSSPIPMPTPAEFSYTTENILQISGYNEENIKGKITTAWDSSQTSATFHAKMRCNNGGLADHIDCEITLTEVISSETDGFTGYFKVTMNDAVRHAKIKGSVSVDGNRLSLHTEEYDYRLVAMLSDKENNSKADLVTFYSLKAIQFNGEKATGLIGMEFGENQSALTLTGTFTASEQTYTLQLDEFTSLSDNKINGVFSVLCDEEPVITRVAGTIENLSAPLGDVMILNIEGFVTLKLRVVEIGY